MLKKATTVLSKSTGIRSLAAQSLRCQHGATGEDPELIRQQVKGDRSESMSHVDAMQTSHPQTFPQTDSPRILITGLNAIPNVYWLDWIQSDTGLALL